MHGSLVALAVRWLARRCSIVFYEFAAAAQEIPDAIGWRSNRSMLIECKTSRSDFQRDAKKLFRQYPEFGMGRHRYYLCPPGVIQVDDLPARWGLLWAAHGRVRIKREAEEFVCDQTAEIKFLVSMLRRTQVRLGSQPLSTWLRWENMS